MSLRRSAPLALVIAVLACQPSVDRNTTPGYINYAVLDPSASPPAIPTPNDLALLAADTTPGAQGELLQAFAAAGGFPNDQEVPITFDFVRTPVNGAADQGPPDLDVGTAFTFCTVPGSQCNLLLMQVAGAGSPLPLGPSDVDLVYTVSGGKGTLQIRNKPHPITPGDPSSPQSRRWPAGARYVAAIRGGASGVKTRSGEAMSRQPTMELLLLGKDLSEPSNQGLLPGTPEEKAAAGQQLELVRRGYVLPPQGSPPGTPSVYQAIDAGGFPHGELADLTTFAVAGAAGTYVAVDESAGIVPLPSDLLLDPATGKVVNNPDAFQALAPGIATLDGFSTTAMLLAPVGNSSGTPAAIQASTVTGQTVFLFELGATGAILLPDLVSTLPSSGVGAAYVAQPSPIVQGGLSQVIGLQPAVAAPVPGLGTFYLPPLKEATEYAVVITKDVLDAAGSGLVRSTVGTILLLDNPVSIGGKSQLAGVSDAQAGGLEAIRQGVAAASAALPSPLTKADVAMAYTFRTQTITEPALELAALPYQIGVPDAPTSIVPRTTTEAEMRYGLPAGTLSPLAIARVLDATVVTFDLLDPATGAFHANPLAGQATPIPALVVIPAMMPPPGGAPLVVFRHGITRGRADMLAIATALAGQGMVVAAIDAVKHGDRSWCSTDADCASGACTPEPLLANQGDAPGPTPGSCGGGLALEPVAGLTACPAGSCWDGSGGIATASGNYFVSANLFRTRDSMRQDIIDQSVLVRALTSANGQAAIRQMVPAYAVDPQKVYFVGQSLGAIQGAVDVAANPRFSRAVLNVGGGTVADVVTTSPAFQAEIAALLASIGITPGTAAYLQFLHVAKWILDPADPINFAQHLVTAPLPNLLVPGSLQAPKAVLGQAARCDSVVPNAEEELLAGLVGLLPPSPTAASATPSMQWYMVDTTTACPADGSTGAGGASHGFLLDLANPSLTSTAQTNVALFLLGQPVAATPVTP